MKLKARKIHKTPRIPDARTSRISNELQKAGDDVHRMDVEDPAIASLTLASDCQEKLFEAILAAENFLSYNGSWDFQRKEWYAGGKYMCDIIFKWNGLASTADKMKSLKLPQGVKERVWLQWEQ